MGITKQYLRFVPHSQFGVIGSTRCNVLFLSLRNTTSRFIASGSCENVTVWDVRTRQKVMVLLGDKHEATILAKSPDHQHLAVGYSDGAIRVFSLLTSEVMVTFSGHRSAVTSLAYDHQGMKLASGSNDTEVVVWDLVNESGLFRLKGHKGQITRCQFIKRKNMLVTSSKDSFVKWWDLDTQHCFKTMVGHRAEVWDFVITPDEEKLITGSSDSELRVWSVKFCDQIDEPPAKISRKSEEEEEQDDAVSDERQIVTTKLGSVLRKETDRVMSMCASADGRFLCCHGNNKNVEIFRIRTEEEAKLHQKKRLKKVKKKIEQEKQKTGTEEGGTEISEPSMEMTIDDRIFHTGSYYCPAKVRSIDISGLNPKSEVSFAALLSNNQIDVRSTNWGQQNPEFTQTAKLALCGHRTECRSAAFTSDGLALLTASAKTAKLWNRSSQQCIRTSVVDQACVCMFVPGDKHFLIGTKSGHLEIHDIPSGNRIEVIEAHKTEITSIFLFPDKRGFATGSKDKTVKFWEFDLILDDNFSASEKRLTASHTRTLQLEEEVTAIEFSSNRKLIACALLDCSVKVFYVDTLKFFLSLYGHSLPVHSISITDDSTLIATGSSDRNIKLWGLDFGDCHKSMFAHDDTITCLKFLPDTHLLFSCAKDGLIKQWDADKFLLIQTLQGHHGAVWCLTVEPKGDYVASVGADRSIRLWSRSPEVVIPDEEREREREEEDEKRLVKNLETTVAGQTEPDETGMAGKKTIETVKGAERIMEALELAKEETAKRKEWEALAKREGSKVTKFKPHPILQAYGNISPPRYVLDVIRKVKSSELEESLLVMPFSYIPHLLELLNQFVKSGWEVELSCRCLFFLLKIHHGIITSNQMLVPILQNLQESTETKVQLLLDTIGFNLAALRHLKAKMEAKHEVTFFADATDRFRQKNRKRKKKLQQAVITM